METSFFLGANTVSGFCSLYAGFCRGEGDYLRIVKGGPGTGKSGFMRAVAREAARRGHDVELVRCSGDPGSLDGVYIPSLRLGYADGTAPHVSEPGVFGVDGDYVNLGSFCRTPLSSSDAARAAALNAAYKARYARAYALLAAGGQIESALAPEAVPAETAERAAAVLRALVDRIAPPGGEPGTLSRRFAGAVSCEGFLADESYLELCKLVYVCEDGCGLAAGALAAARDEALARGRRVVEFLSPFDGGSTEAVLLPGLSAAFVRGAAQRGAVKKVALDRLCGPLDEIKERRRRLRAARRERARCAEAACGLLAEAKALHDQLERVYRPYMDFPSLDAFTAKEIARVFA
jgi:hypothetical protein